MFFAFVTVVITVHAYVFYSLYVVNGSLLMNLTGESSVIRAINAQIQRLRIEIGNEEYRSVENETLLPFF